MDMQCGWHCYPFQSDKHTIRGMHETLIRDPARLKQNREAIYLNRQFAIDEIDWSLKILGRVFLATALHLLSQGRYDGHISRAELKDIPEIGLYDRLGTDRCLKKFECTPDARLFNERRLGGIIERIRVSG